MVRGRDPNLTISAKQRTLRGGAIPDPTTIDDAIQMTSGARRDIGVVACDAGCGVAREGIVGDGATSVGDMGRGSVNAEGTGTVVDI